MIEEFSFHTIVEAAPNAMILVDNQGNIEFLNTGAELMFEYPREELLGKKIETLIPEAHRKNHVHHRDEFFENPHTRQMGVGRDLFGRKKSGAVFPVEIGLNSVQTPSGSKVLAAVTDISVRKSQEEKIQSLAAFQTAILSNAGLATIATDLEGIVTTFNRAAEELLGYTKDEIVGRHNPGLWHDPGEIVERAESLSKEVGVNIEPGFEVFVHKARAGTPETREWTFITKQGRRVPVLLTASAIVNDSGHIVGFVGLVHNLESRKEEERLLLEARQKAEEANKSKSLFLANMSHEIRTPLNAVLGLMQLLEKSDLNNTQKDYVRRAIQGGEALLSLLNDILDFSKIEANKITLDHHYFEWDDLFENLASITGSLLGSKKIDLVFSVASNFPKAAYGDSLRIQQILVNLLSNAIKFTEKGFVRLEAEMSILDIDTQMIGFTVEDTGIGLDEDQREKLFQSFTQADASTSRKYGGTGLGLVITRRLVEMLGGTIKLESERGKGSKFSFTIIVKKAMAKNLIPENPKPGNYCISMKSVNNLGPIVQELNRLGLKPTIIEPEALVQYTHQIDCLFVDFDLSPRKGVPKIAKTVKVVSLIDQLGEEHGQDDNLGLILKPITPRAIRQQITESIDPAPGAEGANPEKLLGLKILVVDDNKTNQFIVSEIIKKQGGLVEVADDGQAAIDKTTSSDFDVVLMDVQMPILDGYAATKKLRVAGNRTPIIGLSANAMREDYHAAIEAGMNGYLPKPFKLDELVAEIKNALRGRPARPNSA